MRFCFHIKFIIQWSTETGFWIFTKILEFCDELGNNLRGRGFPLDMSFAVYLLFVFGDVAKQELVFIANTIGNCFGGGLKLSKFADVDKFDLAFIECFDGF